MSNLLQKTFINQICRTCYHSSSNYHGLNKQADAGKSFAEMLLEVASINIKLANTKSLPQYICDSCAQQLKNAFHFVQQAQRVNKELLSTIKKTDDNALESVSTGEDLECLLETAIDIPDNTDFKTELDNDADNFDDSDDEFLVPAKRRRTEQTQQHNDSDPITTRNMKNRADEHSEEEAIADGTISDESDYLPTQKEMREMTKRKKQLNNLVRGSDGRFHCDVCPSSFSWRKDLYRHERTHAPVSVFACDKCDHKFKRKDHLQSHLSRIHPLVPKVPVKNLYDAKKPYKCVICQQTFVSKKNLFRHANVHKKQPEIFNCDYCEKKFLRQDKHREHLRTHLRQLKMARERHTAVWDFAERLYAYKPLRSVQCKLCEQQFERIKDLRAHLVKHKNASTLTHLNANNALVKELYAQPSAISNWKQLRQQISKDIAQKDYDKYYAIVNAYGYELSVSDSDDSEVDEEQSTVAKYKCAVCQYRFTRKYKLLAHARDEHSQRQWPHQCVVCRMPCISSELLCHHLQSHCHNKNKKYHCAKCPGKFSTRQHMLQHDCYAKKHRHHRQQQIKKETNQKVSLPPAQQLPRCNVCGKSFLWVLDLQNHQRRHKLNMLDCSHCAGRFESRERLEQHMLQQHQLIEKSINCCLCTMKFRHLYQLRVHLQQHAIKQTTVDIKRSQYFAVYYAQASLEQKQTALTQISKQLSAKQFTFFYDAVSASGNELDLDDSESDDEFGAKLTLPKQQCEVCTQTFRRRKQLLAHQNAKHAQHQPLPYACPHCQQQFVSITLLDWHEKHSRCKNVAKKYRCVECNAAFVWHKNLLLHEQIKHATTSSSRQAASSQLQQPQKQEKPQLQAQQEQQQQLNSEQRQLECDRCGRRFQRQTALKSHLTTHALEELSSTSRSKRTKTEATPNNSSGYIRSNGKKRVECAICSSKHNKLDILRKHMWEKHGVKATFENES